MLLAVRFERAVDRSDKQRGMRPRRLREILDDAGNAVVAFDQQHVARLHDVAQMLGIARRKRFEPDSFVLKISGNQLSDRVEHEAHDRSPSGSFWPLFCPLYLRHKRFQFSSCALTAKIKTFTMRRCRDACDGASSRDVLVLGPCPAWQSSGNHDMRFSRRDFLAASAAAMASRAAARAVSGAAAEGCRHRRGRRGRGRHRRGAAGAGGESQGCDRRGVQPDRRPLLDRHRTFGVPFDRGARWLYSRSQSVSRGSHERAMDVYAAPHAQKIRIGRRNARAGETEEFLASLVRANRAIGDPKRRADVARLTRCRRIWETGPGRWSSRSALRPRPRI